MRGCAPPSPARTPPHRIRWWRAKAARLETDAATGLLRVELPAGELALRIARGWTGAERIGLLVSALALLAWLLVLVRTRPRLRRAPSSP